MRLLRGVPDARLTQLNHFEGAPRSPNEKEASLFVEVAQFRKKPRLQGSTRFTSTLSSSNEAERSAFAANFRLLEFGGGNCPIERGA